MEPSTSKRTLPTLITGGGPEKKKTRCSVGKGDPCVDTQDELSDNPEGKCIEAEYSLTSSTVEEYIPANLARVERVIANEINLQNNVPSPVFPPTPESMDEFDFAKVMKEIEQPTKLLSEALPEVQGYEAVKITARKAVPEQIKPIADHNIATELIHKRCTYWEQYRRLLRPIGKGESRREVSIYDGVNVNAYKDRKGRMYATRLYKTAEILSNTRNPKLEAIYQVKVVWTIPEEINPKKIPTACIPPDSPYYAKLMKGMKFPEKGHWWYHRKAEDQVWVHIRADSKRYIHAHRNGITVELFIAGKQIRSSNIRGSLKADESQPSTSGTGSEQ